jgi:predicted 2-oxoglutarate/Fe(II)-dependent dioxygenase YbiX
MTNLIKRDNLIWEWQDVTENTEDILKKVLLKDHWVYYTNDFGTGAFEAQTIKGRSTSVWPDEDIYPEILDIYQKCLSEYCSLNSLDLPNENIDSGRWLFREYNPGTKLAPHNDAYSYVKDQGNSVRPVLTILLYLNDDYVGGEIDFPDDNLCIKPKAGSVVIFPSEKIHSVLEMSSGKRYMTQTYVYERAYNSYDQDWK